MADHITDVTRFLKEHYKAVGYVDPPYHNLKHIHGMHSIARQLGYNKHLSKDELEVIDYACLFHDALHTGGKRPDTYNVNTAIVLFRHYAELVNDTQDTVITDDIYEAVVNAIRCTVFPFTREPETEVERCIRDADLLYAILHSDPAIIMDDLRVEMEISQYRSISYAEMYTSQVSFMRNIVMYTEEGQMAVHNHTPIYLAKMKAYV